MRAVARSGEISCAVSFSSFIVMHALSAAALALWIDVRFPQLSAGRALRVFAHLVGALVVVRVLMPELGGALRASEVPAALPLVALGIALPALTYLFLSSLWVLKLTQRLMTRT